MSAGPSAAETGRIDRVGLSAEMNVPSGTPLETRNETQYDRIPLVFEK